MSPQGRTNGLKQARLKTQASPAANAEEKLSSEKIDLLKKRWANPLPITAAQFDKKYSRTFQGLLNYRLDRHEVIYKSLFDYQRTTMIEDPPQIGPHSSEFSLNIISKDLRNYGLDFQSEIPNDEIDFRGADLVRRHFNSEPLRDAHFEAANCQNASFNYAYCRGTHFENANLWNTNFKHATCVQAQFSNASCWISHFDSSFCDSANFNRADCRDTRFDYAECGFASFENALLRNTSFVETKAFGARFNNAWIGYSRIDKMLVSEETVFGTPGEELWVREPSDTAIWFKIALPSAKWLIPNDSTAWSVLSDRSKWFGQCDTAKWLAATDANLRIKQCWKTNGIYHKADVYHYQEMVCRRNAQSSNFNKFFEGLLGDKIAGYGVKLENPIIIGSISILISTFFFWLPVGNRKYVYTFPESFFCAIICFTTAGFGRPENTDSFLQKTAIGVSALSGALSLPLFLLAFAHKLLQGG